MLLEHGQDNRFNYEVVGRVLASTIIDNINFTAGYIASDEEIEKIKDGRLKDRSVGFIAVNKKCSICGAPVKDYFFGPPQCTNEDEPHTIGEEYDGKLAYIIVDEGIAYRELSHVWNPATVGSATIGFQSVKWGDDQDRAEFNIHYMDSYSDICDGLDICVIDSENAEDPALRDLGQIYVVSAQFGRKQISTGDNPLAKDDDENDKKDKITKGETMDFDAIKKTIDNTISDKIQPLVDTITELTDNITQLTKLEVSLDEANAKIK